MSEIKNTYETLYTAFSELREHLHLSGRIDDSNAKLDEVSKILAICIATNNNWIKSKDFEQLVKSTGSNINAIDILHLTFEECTKDEHFLNSDKTSIFGASPKLNIQKGENEFALILARTIYTTFINALNHAKSNNSFDLVNEAFGHFIRDNFRGNIEDAQYMTPPEVVDFICDWALSEIPKSFYQTNEFLVMDPSCGVGSFLASFYRKATLLAPSNKIKLIGQDKVDRMVRLSKINMMLFGNEIYDIDQGNSLINCSRLEAYNGKVDLIITNPPFGANISTENINSQLKENYPLFYGLETSTKSIDSELAFIDRELSLLKNGGKLFVVVPDSTVSSRGLAETLRARLIGKAKLKGIIELPAVTFAQAGTRTKTSIVYLEKGRENTKEHNIVMGTINDLGFQVALRKGVSIKKYEGINQLDILGKKLFESEKNIGIISETPSCTLELSSIVESGSWTASHYSSRRIKALKTIESFKNYIIKDLKDIVTFETKNRRRLKEEDNSKCISVLHIIGDGIIDFEELQKYEPKTKGNVCYPMDILISKINPRIPRIIVVPQLDFPTTCSSEFEIVRAKEGIDPYWVCYMLLEPLIQDQIQSLTSGTSSSHNRIKTNELEIVKLPVPNSEKEILNTNKIINIYKDSIENIVSSSLTIDGLRKKTV
ncbi:N-6 DNA methylase [Sulfurospirillum arcachonense]|uniref:N-6 DNA methylase n=1 Tax=Sulfurospirillum arcachonense TaxID=57666 RepID=UPI00046A0C62|nr:N-6 DNA methylase [Sulfurospirillum arcachonense]